MRNHDTNKVGDHVKIVGEENFVYEITATKLKPHIAVDKAIINVPKGSDYVLRMLDQEKQFEPYRYVVSGMLLNA